MRILFISHYFPPEVNAPASRTHEHCRQWVEEGHDVTVITGVPNHPTGQLFGGYKNRFIQEESIDGIRVIRTWMLLTSNAGFAKRILNFLLFALMSVIASFKVRKPDVVIATSPQFFCGLAGAVTARIKRRPFILEIRDLWPKSIVELDQISEGPALDFLQWLERRMYQSADGIVVNTRAFVDHITQLGYPKDQIEIVYNGIDAGRFKPQGPSNELRARFDLEGRFTVGYLGTLGLAHGLGTLLETAENLRDQPEIAFLLIGDGAEKKKLEALIEEKKLPNVRLLGLQPREMMPAWIATTDILLVCLRDLPVFETVIPSKIFEFLAQERPVIVAARGEIRQMTETSGVALTIDPEDPEALAYAIDEIRREPEAARERAEKGRIWVEENFVRRDLADKMIAFVEDSVERSQR
ncbi:MAG: glycosyltransferase family 4 protein [Myxococcota bacterium]|nr:glycosyltransferase family 4 protein [Myxococcota bacterium]